MKIYLLLIMLAIYSMTWAQLGSFNDDTPTNTASSEHRLIDKSKRHTMFLGGIAATDGRAGINLEVGGGYQPGGFGVGAYTSFISIPSTDFSSWTIVGLQLRGGPQSGEIKPYFLFNYGMINLNFVSEKVNLRTATLDLGGGIEKPLNKNALLFDIKWKRFVDYKGERDGFTIWTFSVGLKF
ncbi:MAG: hypothetical protein KF687_01920 [Cyclobacteriaceae bacterium]|nr:hypothetical protein [Cyclobacteriaceae bacterium]